jgi:N-acetyl-alpha-D-muramate 1-phosphate uridylyltransferase
MKAMILAAGRGERLRPYTDSVPKPLLPVAGKPLIEYHIEALVRAGIREIVINVSHLGEQIMAHIGSGKRWQIDIQYSVEPQALETAGGIAKALPLLQSPTFIVVNADVWCDYPFEKLSLPAASEGHLVLIPNPSHHVQGDFSLLRTADPHRQIVTPGQTDSLTFSGISVLTEALFANVPKGQKAALAPLLRTAMQRQAITGECYTGTWIDVGTPERLHALEQHLKQQT